MQVLRSEDIKRINKTIIRNVLLELKSATRKELSFKTGISNAAIGTFLSEMLLQDDIIESMDSSSGGRCPSRYSLNPEKYRVLCVQLQNNEHDVFVRVYDHEINIIHQASVRFNNEQSISKQLNNIINEYQVKVMAISVVGILKGDKLLQGEDLIENTVIQEIKETIDIPIILENDVNCMLKGYSYFEKPDVSDIAYLHFTEEGMGGAWIANYELIKGKDYLAGELGLLDYDGRSLNSWCADEHKANDLGNALAYFVKIVVCCINPEIIVLSGVKVNEEIRQDILDKTQQIVNHHFSVNIEIDEAYDERIWMALWQMAMECLLH